MNFMGKLGGHWDFVRKLGGSHWDFVGKLGGSWYEMGEAVQKGLSFIWK